MQYIYINNIFCYDSAGDYCGYGFESSKNLRVFKHNHALACNYYFACLKCAVLTKFTEKLSLYSCLLLIKLVSNDKKKRLALLSELYVKITDFDIKTSFISHNKATLDKLDYINYWTELRNTGLLFIECPSCYSAYYVKYKGFIYPVYTITDIRGHEEILDKIQVVPVERYIPKQKPKKCSIL